MECMKCSLIAKIQTCGWVCAFLCCSCLFGLCFSSFLRFLEDILNVSSATNIYFIGGVIFFTLLFIIIKRISILDKCYCHACLMEDSSKDLNALELQTSEKKSRNFFFKKKRKCSSQAKDAPSEDNHLANSTFKPYSKNNGANITKYQSIPKYQADHKPKNAPLQCRVLSNIQGTSTNAVKYSLPKKNGFASDKYSECQYTPTPTVVSTMINPSHQKLFSPVYDFQGDSEDRFKKKNTILITGQIYSSDSEFDSPFADANFKSSSPYPFIEKPLPKRTRPIINKSITNDQSPHKYLYTEIKNRSVEQWLKNTRNKYPTCNIREYSSTESE